MAKVTVRINKKTSQVKYAAEGMEGASCDEVLDFVKQTGEVTDKQYTDEYYVPDVLPDFVNEGE